MIGDFGGEILVGKSGEAVAKFMRENIRRLRVVGRPAGIKVVHPAASVGICIDEEENRVARNVPNRIANGGHIGRCQVAVDAEGVIACVQGCVLKDAFAGNIRARIFRYQFDCPYVEILSSVGKRRDGEEGFHEAACVGNLP